MSQLHIDTEAGTITRPCPQFGYARGGYIMNLSHLFKIADTASGSVRIPALGVVVTQADGRRSQAEIDGVVVFERRAVRSFTLEAI